MFPSNENREITLAGDQFPELEWNIPFYFGPNWAEFGLRVLESISSQIGPKFLGRNFGPKRRRPGKVGRGRREGRGESAREQSRSGKSATEGQGEGVGARGPGRERREEGSQKEMTLTKKTSIIKDDLSCHLKVIFGPNWAEILGRKNTKIRSQIHKKGRNSALAKSEKKSMVPNAWSTPAQSDRDL